MRKKIEKQKIFRAALQVFAEFGYKKTTVEDIAKELDMTKGNLYLYARGKKDLYHQTVEYALTEWQNRVIKAVNKEDDVKNKFLIMCRKAVEYLLMDNNFRQVLIRDPDIFPMFAENDPFKEINQKSVNMISVIIKQGIKENAFRNVNVKNASNVIFSIYKMMIIRTYIKTDKKSISSDINKLFNEAIGMLTLGLFK